MSIDHGRFNLVTVDERQEISYILRCNGERVAAFDSLVIAERHRANRAGRLPGEWTVKSVLTTVSYED